MQALLYTCPCTVGPTLAQPCTKLMWSAKIRLPASPQPWTHVLALHRLAQRFDADYFFLEQTAYACDASHRGPYMLGRAPKLTALVNVLTCVCFASDRVLTPRCEWNGCQSLAEVCGPFKMISNAPPSTHRSQTHAHAYCSPDHLLSGRRRTSPLTSTNPRLGSPLFPRGDVCSRWGVDGALCSSPTRCEFCAESG